MFVSDAYIEEEQMPPSAITQSVLYPNLPQINQVGYD